MQMRKDDLHSGFCFESQRLNRIRFLLCYIMTMDFGKCKGVYDIRKKMKMALIGLWLDLICFIKDCTPLP